MAIAKLDRGNYADAVNATVDRFGRLVVPKRLRTRLGWRAGTRVRLVPTDRGVEILADEAPPPAPPGLRWENGLLVAAGKFRGKPPDLERLRRRLAAERDREIVGREWK
jgi:AbrB family looped-hinge helix DNA binding protein